MAPKEPELAHIPTSKYNVETTQQGPQSWAKATASVFSTNPYNLLDASPPTLPQTRSIRRLNTLLCVRPHEHRPRPPPATASQEEDGPGFPGATTAASPKNSPGAPPIHASRTATLTSPQFTRNTATRIIRIRRDWMVVGDLAPTFSNIYPEILDPLMQEQNSAT